jgi:hypothetical protein
VLPVLYQLEDADLGLARSGGGRRRRAGSGARGVRTGGGAEAEKAAADAPAAEVGGERAVAAPLAELGGDPGRTGSSAAMARSWRSNARCESAQKRLACPR